MGNLFDGSFDTQPRLKSAKAYAEGLKAASEGLALTDNPFVATDPDHTAWDHGFADWSVSPLGATQVDSAYPYGGGWLALQQPLFQLFTEDNQPIYSEQGIQDEYLIHAQDVPEPYSLTNFLITTEDQVDIHTEDGQVVLTEDYSV